MAGRGAREGGVEALYPRGFWHALSAPGLLWLVALFLVPFYAIAATAAGRLDPIFGTSVPEWNPLYWQPDAFRFVLGDLAAPGGVIREVFLRTLAYVLVAVGLSLVVGYPVAYYMSRLRGRARNVFTLLVVLPFWVSYLMRIFAWVNLLRPDGLVNRLLALTGVLEPQDWLNGRASTVILGLVYGWVPFLILPIFAALERIDERLVEGALDLGASPARAFLRVTLPLSAQGVLAGTVIIMLPMFGDFYTAQLLGTQRNTMVGALINFYLTQATVGAGQARGAALVIVLAALVSVLTVYYLVSTARAAREATR
ncbi:MAG TPA: ABC transporter permease [Actinomycetota bacterium]|nr:ABC transporter permease [Actinomycetota bacterium]